MRKTLLFAFLLIGLRMILAQEGWNWQNPLPQGNSLYDVSFTSADTGTAVGVLGTIIRTTDGGMTWTNQSSDTTNTLRGSASPMPTRVLQLETRVPYFIRSMAA